MLPRLSNRRWMLIYEYRPRIVSLARQLGAGDDAEDIAQEALLRAASYTDFDETRSQAFLFAVAARMTVDLHRRTARLRRVEMLISGWPETESMEEQIVDREAARSAARLLATQLPTEIQRILMQRADGIGWHAIAAERGESVRALETRVRRALTKIRAGQKGPRPGVHPSGS